MSPPAPRRRNAAATRAGILEAARRRFSQDGYEAARLRDIASDVGVDVALVARYFGSKDQLFKAVLIEDGPRDEVLREGRAGFCERAARMLVQEPRDDGKLERLLMILRSASAPKAAEVIRANSHETFYRPLEDMLDGDDRAVRARLMAILITGLAINRVVDEDYMLDADGRARLQKRVAHLLHGLAEEGGEGPPPPP